MCGSVSAIGLQDDERRFWPELRERLRVPDHLMALMRGVLGDVEVAVVVAVTPDGVVDPRAVLASPEIRDEIDLAGAGAPPPDSDGLAVQAATIGDDAVQVITRRDEEGRPQPLAVLSTPWIDQHLLLYARTLWHRRR